jgi:endonuclease YncB( thermonuclease family)
VFGAIGAITDEDSPGEAEGGATAAADPGATAPAPSHTGSAPLATGSAPSGAGSGSSTAGGTTEPSLPSPTRKPTPATFLVTRVVDGDTIELGNGETVRVVGIDTPERGECGYDEAGSTLAALVLGKRVRLTVSDEDTDHYGRLLRYVNVAGVDAGLSQISAGLAVARYDSRDGYGYHPREDAYIAADQAHAEVTCATPAEPTQPPQQPSGGGCMAGYEPCLQVLADLDCAEIGHPVRVTGNDPYRLDADGDGVGCDA